jgi:pectate lyase
MKKILYTLCILNFALCTLHSLPAFPGAEGYGSDTPGGRGGKVYIVTNLDPSGPGSFGDAIRATEPRIIVFRVSGVIDMKIISSWKLSDQNAYVTVAGQTSPGGITLTSTTNDILICYKGNFNNGIFRFLRFRAPATVMDALTFNTTNNFIFDHCDFSGARDETLDICGSHHFTVQWCTMTNSMSDKINKGQLTAYPPTSHITLHHNFYAHHQDRCGAYFHWASQPAPDFGMIDYRNNVCYNSGVCRFMRISHVEGPTYFNVVGNYFKAGPNTESFCTVENTRGPVSLSAQTSLYADMNHWISADGSESSNVLDTRFSQPIMLSVPHDMPHVTTQSAQEAYDLVLDKAGTFPRDAMNVRTVNEMRTGTGQFRKIDDPLIESGPEPPADTDLDGMPDEWENMMGFNPNYQSDNIGDHDGDGYTNIEEYINDLALILLGEPPHNTGIESSDIRKGVSYELNIHPMPYYGLGTINLGLSLTAGNQFKGMVRISDIQGKLVTSFKAKHRTVWNGKDRHGNRLAPGVFMVRLMNGQKMLAQKRIIIIN